MHPKTKLGQSTKLRTGTDLEIGAILDREGGATRGDRVRFEKIGACGHAARHAVSARSEVGPKMWRGTAWRGRAGQAFELGEPGVVDGTTADSLAADRRGPRQDDQVVKTKPLTGSCLRILDQGLGPTRARSSRNRPLEQPGTMAGLAQGWAGHPCQSRRMRLTSRRTPAPDVDAPRLVTRWSNRNLCLSSDSCLLE